MKLNAKVTEEYKTEQYKLRRRIMLYKNDTLRKAKLLTQIRQILNRSQKNPSESTEKPSPKAQHMSLQQATDITNRALQPIIPQQSCAQKTFDATKSIQQPSTSRQRRQPATPTQNRASTTVEGSQPSTSRQTQPETSTSKQVDRTEESVYVTAYESSDDEIIYAKPRRRIYKPMSQQRTSIESTKDSRKRRFADEEDPLHRNRNPSTDKFVSLKKDTTYTVVERKSPSLAHNRNKSNTKRVH